MSHTAPSEKMIRSMVAQATPQNIAFFRSAHWSFLVAMPMRIALSPLMTRSMRMILRSAKSPAEVKRCDKSAEREVKKSGIERYYDETIVLKGEKKQRIFDRKRKKW